MKNINKDYILNEIRRIAAESGGNPPGIGKFAKLTGIGRGSLTGNFWKDWASAVTEAGFSPNTMQVAYSIDYLMECLANLAREIKKIPNSSDIRFAYNNKHEVPSYNTFTNRLSTQKNIEAHLYDFVQKASQYRTIFNK